MSSVIEPPHAPPRSGLLRRIFEGLGVVAFIVMFGSTLLGVLARFLAVGGVEWSFEVAGIAFIWITFIGMINAELRHENVAFEALKQSAPRRLRLVFEGIAVIAFGAMGIAFLVSGLAVWQRSWRVPTAVLRLPNGVVIATVIILGGAALCIAVSRAWRMARASHIPEERSA